jgi:hypothetical protein
MSYPQTTTPCNPCGTDIGFLDDQRRRIEEHIRRTEELERIRRVRDVHRPHLG